MQIIMYLQDVFCMVVVMQIHTWKECKIIVNKGINAW